MISASLQARLAAALGAPIQTGRPLSGGDINEAFQLRLVDGREVFVKTHPRPPAGMYAAEAHGLAWLGAAAALRVPRVLAVDDAFLVLEFLQSAPRMAGFDEALGRGLAHLHRQSPGRFGLAQDNFIGRLPQPNDCDPSWGWATVYRERRLRPMVAQAGALIDGRLRRRFDRLYERLPALVGPKEPPARLHGDLWGGNLHVDEQGAPCLIDPAVYGGHREVDLAMMRLFGGFNARVFDAYAEVWPLSPGHQARVALYQLYPLLVHVNLFGAGYLGSVARALETLL